MSTFGLLDMVNSITNNTPKTTNNSQKTTNRHDYSINDCATDACEDCEPARDSYTKKSTRKSISDIKSLSFGDSIDDENDVTRYVISVDHNKGTVQLTGKNTNINNYKRTYTWTQKKVNAKVANEGWTLN